MYRDSASENRSLVITAFAGKVFALDRTSGELRWRAETGDYGEVELAIGQGLVIACTHGKISFFSYETGELLKQVALAGSYATRPTMLIDGEQILVGRNGELVSYSLRGDLMWMQPFKGEGLGSVAIGLPGNIRQADDKGSK